MKIKFNFNSLRYLCITFIIALGFITVMATGGGDGGDKFEIGPCDTNSTSLSCNDNQRGYSLHNGSPRNFITFDNKLIFVANKGCGYDVQTKIFGIDKTGNINEIFDLSAFNLLDGSGLSIGKQIIVNDVLYFTHDGYLYKYDGSNTPEIIFSDASYQKLMEYNNKLYFNFCDADWIDNEPTDSCGLYSYDGANPPVFIEGSKGIAITPYQYNIPNYVVYNGKLYFLASGSDLGGLWCYDENTNELDKIIIDDTYYVHDDFVIFQDKLFFSVFDNINGTELWMIDGENPPVKVTDLTKIEYYNEEVEPRVTAIAVFQEKLLCAVTEYIDPAGLGIYESVNSLWQYDGINPMSRLPVEDSYDCFYWLPYYIFNNHFYFRARAKSGDHSGASGLWEYDGINPPVARFYSYYINELIIDNGKAFFQGFYGTSIYSYDGISEPELLCTASDLGANYIDSIYVLNDNYYITGNDPEKYGSELWKIDSTGETSLVEDFYQGVDWYCDYGD